MATMKTLNGYGFNATEFDGKTASDYLLKTGTAADSAKLGGKVPEYYLSPRNLLDNSDFQNPVNQRGIIYGITQNSGYTIDRWYYEQSAGAKNGYFGLTVYYISLLAPSDGYSQMYQNLEKYAKLKGKNVTFVARVGHINVDKIVCVTFTLGSIDVGLNLFEDGNLKLYSVDGMNILIRATGAEEFRFFWAALYEGSYTADTLPLYVPKGYAAELEECRRYFRRYTANNASLILSGFVSSSAKTISVNAPELAPMRTKNVSIAYSGSGVIIRGVSGYATECSNSSIYGGISVSPYQNNSSFCATIDMNKKDGTAWGLTNNTPVVVQFAANSTLDYIADL